ncbi:hypothetical protein JFU49_26955 [Pseudomonas sp. TH03]|nr:hypothetical protein [Pseudomonas sp. TH03]
MYRDCPSRDRLCVFRKPRCDACPLTKLIGNLKDRG